jgi:RNA polymerase sigma-70 factor (ECF subfamily)
MAAKFDITPHLEDLWRYARVLTRDDVEADDLVQEALARALAFSRSFDTTRPLLPWLVKILRNTFMAGVTRKSTEKRRLQVYSLLSNPQLLPSQEHSADLVNVRRAIGALPAEQGEVLHLVGVLGFTYADAAGILGVPTGTVMSRLSRARAALRQSLQHSGAAAPAMLRVVGGRDETD